MMSAESPRKMQRSGPMGNRAIETTLRRESDQWSPGSNGGLRMGTPGKGLLRPKFKKADASRRVQWHEDLTEYPERTGLMTPRSSASAGARGGQSMDQIAALRNKARGRATMSFDVERACECADFAALRRLHLQGHDMGGFDVVGDRTPIHIAAAIGSMEIVRYLIDHADVDPEVLSGSGMTALSMAKQAGHYPVITLLSGGDGSKGGAPHQDPLPTMDALGDSRQHGHASAAAAAAAAGASPMDMLSGQRGGGGGRPLQRDLLRRGSWSKGDAVGGRGVDSMYSNVQWRGGGGGPWMNHVREHGLGAGSGVRSSGWIQGGEQGGTVHHAARFAPFLGRPPPSKNKTGQQRASVVDDDRDWGSSWQQGQQGQGNQGEALMRRMPQHQYQQQHLQRSAGVRGVVDQRRLIGDDGSSKRHHGNLSARGAASGHCCGNDANTDHNNDTDDNNIVEMPPPHSSGVGAKESSNATKHPPARNGRFDQVRPVSSGTQAKRLSFSSVSRGGAGGAQDQQQFAMHLQRLGGQSLYGGAEAAAFKGPGNNSINNYYNNKKDINNSGMGDTVLDSGLGSARGVGGGYVGGGRPVTAQAESAAKPWRGGGFVVGLSKDWNHAHMGRRVTIVPSYGVPGAVPGTGYSSNSTTRGIL